MVYDLNLYKQTPYLIKKYAYFIHTISSLTFLYLSMSNEKKSKKNSKVNLGGSYKFKIAAKYKKPKTRGDKNYNKRNKKK